MTRIYQKNLKCRRLISSVVSVEEPATSNFKHRTIDVVSRLSVFILERSISPRYTISPADELHVFPPASEQRNQTQGQPNDMRRVYFYRGPYNDGLYCQQSGRKYNTTDTLPRCSSIEDDPNQIVSALHSISTINPV